MSKLRPFFLLSLTATLSTYFLIFIGGLVRVSGAGLGCPDWPKCFGRWIPPLDKSQLPAGFNPDTFNFTLAWIEYINRLIGVFVGLLILATAIYAILYLWKHKNLVFASAAAAILVAVQGWFGSIVVSSHLRSWTITVHLLLALLIVTVLLWIVQKTNHLMRQSSFNVGAGIKRVRLFVAAIYLITLIQIIMGAQTRAQIEELLLQFPLLSGMELMQSLGWVHYLHGFLGMVVLFLVGGLGLLMFRQEIHSEFRFLYALAAVFVIAQVLLGLGMEMLGLPQLLQVFHLWIAAIFIGLLMILFIDLKYQLD